MLVDSITTLLQSTYDGLQSIIDADEERMLTDHCFKAASLGRTAFASLKSAEITATLAQNHVLAETFLCRKNEISALLLCLNNIMSPNSTFSLSSIDAVLFEGRDRHGRMGETDQSIVCFLFRSRNVTLIRAMLFAAQPDLMYTFKNMFPKFKQPLLNHLLFLAFTCMRKNQSFWTAAVINAGFNVTDLKFAGVGADILKSARFTLQELIDGGFGICDFQAAGFTAAEISSANYGLAVLLEVGYNISALKCIGFSSNRFKNEGCSAWELKGGGFSAEELKDAGYDLKSLLDAGYSVSELRSAGYTAGKLTRAGCSIDEMKDGGLTAADLKAVGFNLMQLKAAGFNLQSLLAAKFFVSELKSTGFTASMLKDEGCSAQELKDGGFSATELKDAGYSLSSLLTAGYIVSELKKAGYMASTLMRAGCSADALKDGGFHPAMVRASFGLNLTSMMSLGFSNAASFKVAGYRPVELIQACHPDVILVRLP